MNPRKDEDSKLKAYFLWMGYHCKVKNCKLDHCKSKIARMLLYHKHQQSSQIQHSTGERKALAIQFALFIF